MSQKSSIEWTDATWNPVRGCSRVSEGCRNCYAERQAGRFAGPSRPFDGFVTIQHETAPRVRWTGKVELVEKHLNDPLRWRTPKRVFVNSMSDLFHENLPDEAIDRVFAVMALCPQHTFQVLTKRPIRMLNYMGAPGFTLRFNEIRVSMALISSKVKPEVDWPLSNVWLGVSVENQETADARIPLLLQTPAAVRFVSYEPALGPVSFRWASWQDYRRVPGVTHNHLDGMRRLNWIIVGGESGPGARPFNVDWAREVVVQCKEAGVACFVKQLGAKPFSGHSLHKQIHHRTTDGNLYLHYDDRKGGDMSEWPEDLRVRQFPEAPIHAR